MQIKANGINFNCQIDGREGAPWLIFSNSLATNLSMWDEQARELGRTFRVLRYDQRGHGGSEAPAGRYNFELLIADAVALLDASAFARLTSPAFRWAAPPRSAWPRPVPSGSTG